MKPLTPTRAIDALIRDGEQAGKKETNKNGKRAPNPATLDHSDHTVRIFFNPPPLPDLRPNVVCLHTEDCFNHSVYFILSFLLSETPTSTFFAFLSVSGLMSDL